MTATADQVYQDITDYIANARAIIDSGEYIELENLDGRVAELCDTIRAMEPEQSTAFADRLDTLLEDLNALQRSFIESRDNLQGELKGVVKHHRANKAYQQSEALAPDSSEPEQD